jgi:hypothetical protein
LAANRKIATDSSASTTKWKARSIAISRSTILSRSGRPRSGSSISSRSGGYSRPACSGGGSGSHESQRRHRCQRTPSISRAISASSGRSCTASVPTS